MSFSAEIKSELLKKIGKDRHCQLAELRAIERFGGEALGDNGDIERKHFTLSEKAFNIKTNAEENLLKKACCRRAYLRGAFLCNGSMSNPSGGYHLEFAMDSEEQARQLIELLGSFALEAKLAKRKKRYVVYLKEGAGIVDLLNVMGAHHALLRLENLRVEKEVRNSINRQVNCETANIEKTVNAAARYIEDIQYIKEHQGFAGLPPKLRQTAEARLANPEASLQELGQLLEPQLGKSGVNHRLRKLSSIREKVDFEG
jgi:DNA-binding protein WhiA